MICLPNSPITLHCYIQNYVLIIIYRIEENNAKGCLFQHRGEYFPLYKVNENYKMIYRVQMSLQGN